jgi:hypothetical protein
MSGTTQAVKQLNKTEIRERGWTDGLIRHLLPDPKIEDRYSYMHGWHTVYLWSEVAVLAAEQTGEFREAQIRREQRKTKLDTLENVDLLVAIFTVNRAAKRQRDLAQKHYRNGMHGFAGSSRKRKEEYYDLKDRGIMSAHQAGQLSCEYRHGNLFLWRGEGYSFHSTLKPTGLEVLEMALNDGQQHLFIEAKPKGAKEPRIADAVYTLEGLVGYLEPDPAKYERVQAPRLIARNVAVPDK